MGAEWKHRVSFDPEALLYGACTLHRPACNFLNEGSKVRFGPEQLLAAIVAQEAVRVFGSKSDFSRGLQDFFFSRELAPEQLIKPRRFRKFRVLPARK